MKLVNPFGSPSATVPVVAIDPGASGGICVIDGDEIQLTAWKSMEQMAGVLRALPKNAEVFVIERVHASPVMGQGAAFAFGENFGWWLGWMSATCRKPAQVPPQVWQKGLGLEGQQGPERKRALKRAAESAVSGVTPAPKVTLATADALLLGLWATANFYRLNLFTKDPQ